MFDGYTIMLIYDAIIIRLHIFMSFTHPIDPTTQAKIWEGRTNLKGWFVLPKIFFWGAY
jgi:hypothetical protein